ncbi:MAG: hypothetical protein ABJC63_01360 [Gemmatimonadales bacterium]
MSRVLKTALWAATAAGLVDCSRLPGREPPPATVWILPSVAHTSGSARSGPAEVAAFQGSLIVVDSLTLSPVLSLAQPDASGGASRIAVVTTYEGNRYHPEGIRALTEDAAASGAFARKVAVAAAQGGTGMFVDFQGSTPDELSANTSILRAIGDSARARGVAPIGIIVPPGDTIGYPTTILARTFDLVVVRLNGEHRNGTSPGPIVSPEWMARQIGMRASAIGINRIVAELPLFGYKWDRSGVATVITFAEAQALMRSEAGVFRRDQASGSITASSPRNGWTIWIEDATTLERLVSVARRAGVRRFALLGPEGADPEIWTRLPAALKR